jgi:hypothetical protein
LYCVQEILHRTSAEGVPDECYVYGRSVHNQRIECYWSGFIRQWAARWQEIFRDIERAGYFIKNDKMDQMAMVYVFMPIIHEEVETHRRGYNSYPIRRNRLSGMPAGAPEDSYVLADPTAEYSVRLDPSVIQSVRDDFLSGFDAETMIQPESRERLNELMQDSPEGVDITIENARRQYEYLRERLRALI